MSVSAAAMEEYGYTELDVQYSPRLWVSRMHEKLVVENHIKITSEESDRVRKVVPNRLLRYGEGPLESMFEFGVDSLPNDAPIFVFIHGGYWQHLSKEISCYPVQPLYDAGIRVLIVGYDLAPNATMKQIVEETKHAGTYAVQLAEKLGSRGVWFSGFSAGGHMTGILFACGWMDSLSKEQVQLVRGFLPISGIFDLKPIVKTYINKPLQMNEEEADRHSPMSMNIKNGPNVIIFATYGQYDSPEFQKQTKDFVKKLQDMKLNANFYEVPGVDHFNLAENLSKPDFILTRKIISLITNTPSKKIQY